MNARIVCCGWKTRLRDQPHALRAIRADMDGGGVALEIGANKGSYLYWLARWARGAPVVAFEPQRSLAAYLKKACDGAGLAHTVVENLVLSDRAGELTLFVPGDEGSPGASLESSVAQRTTCRTDVVQVTTFNAFAKAYIHQPLEAIQIDAEEHVLAVLPVIECKGRHLRTGTGVMNRVRLVENWVYHGSRVWPRRGKLLAAQFDPATHQNPQGERFWDSHDYCNHFIFRPL